MDFAASVLATRSAQAQLALRACKLCPRDCAVDRTVSARGAFCRLGSEAYVYKELFSLGEESAISPTWLIDVGGCSLRCLFCSEWDHVVAPQRAPAVGLSSIWFGGRLQELRSKGAVSLSFVGGDPTVNLPAILTVLAGVSRIDWLPIVWNCNGWLNKQAADLLDGIVSCYIVDAKFGNSACSQRISGNPGTDERQLLNVVLRMALEQRRLFPSQLPPLIVRHLLMPGHFACCTQPVLTWLAQDFPQVPLNLMTAYVPTGPAASAKTPRTPELRNFSAQSDVQAAVAWAKKTTPVLWINGKPSD